MQSQVIKTSTQVALPALTGGGWQVFSVPGEISQSNSNAIIAARQPVAYDAPRRVYAKASRIRGGQAYWVFGEKPAISGISMAPIEAIGALRASGSSRGAPSTVNLLPDFSCAPLDGQLKRFVKTDVIGAYGGLWLYIDGPAPGNCEVRGGPACPPFFIRRFLGGDVCLVVVFSRTDRTDRTDQTDQSNRSVFRSIGPIGPRKDEKIKLARRRAKKTIVKKNGGMSCRFAAIHAADIRTRVG